MQEVNNLMEEMANRISRGGILLQPVFCDFDRRREMCVAKDQVTLSYMQCAHYTYSWKSVIL
jgi:hypothetical protein